MNQPNDIPNLPMTFNTVDDLRNYLNFVVSIKQPGTGAPNYTPQNFLEQFYFTSDKFYVFINGEWKEAALSSSISSAQYKTGTASRGAGTTGNQAITGIGFTPKLLKITAYVYGSQKGYSIGSGTSSSDSNSMIFYYNSVGGWVLDTSTAIIEVFSNTGDVSEEAAIQSLDSDGFTLRWYSVSRNVTFNYECFG